MAVRERVQTERLHRPMRMVHRLAHVQGEDGARGPLVVRLHDSVAQRQANKTQAAETARHAAHNRARVAQRGRHAHGHNRERRSGAQRN